MSENIEVVDAWAEQVVAPAGRLVPGGEALLKAETADLGRSLEKADQDWYGRGIRRLGAARLSGRLVAFDPVMPTGQPLRFPVEVEEANYPAYVLDGDGEDLLVVRLGGGRPATWHEVCSGDGSVDFFPIEAATAAVADEKLHERLIADASLRADVDEIPDRPDAGGPLSTRPDLGMFACRSHGDQLVWGYVGLTAAGEVAAAAIALITDCIYRYRPAADDAQVMDACRALVADLTEREPDEEEIVSYQWPQVLRELSENGMLSGDGRNTLYEVYEALRD